MVMDVGLSETAGSALDGLVGDTEVLKECERIRRGETAEDLVVVSDVVLVLPPKKGKSVRPVLNRVSFGVREGRSRVCLLVGASHFLQSLTVSLPHSPPSPPRSLTCVSPSSHLYLKPPPHALLPRALFRALLLHV